MCLPFLFCFVRFQKTGHMSLQDRHVCWQSDGQFSKKGGGGGRDNIRTTILHTDKTLETNEVCFFMKTK